MTTTARSPQARPQVVNDRYRPANFLSSTKQIIERTLCLKKAGELPVRKPHHDAVRVPEIVSLILENLTTEELYPMTAVSHAFRDAAFQVKKNRKKLFLDFEVRPVPVPANRCRQANGQEHNFNPLIFVLRPGFHLTFARNPLEDSKSLPTAAMCREMYLTQQPVWHATLHLHLFCTPIFQGDKRREVKVEIRITRFRSQGIKYGHVMELVADVASRVQARHGWSQVQADMGKTFLTLGPGREWRRDLTKNESNKIATGELMVSDDLLMERTRLDRVREQLHGPRR